MIRLAIISTHPIQYYAPIFKLLHERQQIAIKVFYSCGESLKNKYDPGFGKKISWDIPLLSGYPYEWVNNKSTKPGSHHFNGIINPDIIKQINTYKPDALLIIGWAYSGHLKVMRHFKNKIPILFRGDSTLLDDKKGLKQILRSIILKWVYKHVDHAFYVGINNKAYFKKHGLKENQLSFAPHAIDNERFSGSREKEVQLLKQTMGIAGGDTVILFAGKFQDKKDPTLLLDAFIDLKKPELHLIFVGNGSLTSHLKLKADSLKNIHFIDFTNQAYIPVIYQCCDLFCLPSKGPGETWGLAVNEAMACSKAILVSDKCGCAADLVEEGINGAIFKSGDVNDLISRLRYLVQSKTVLAKYGEHSAAKIKDWDFSNIVMAIENKLIHETV